MTPAQYWISGGKLGGGLDDSSSDELCRYVNRSTSAKTLVIRCAGALLPEDPAAELDPDPDGAAAELEPAPDEGAAAEARSFSFPRPVAELNAFTNGLISFAGVALDTVEAVDAACALPDDPLGPADDPKRPSFDN